MSTHYQYVSKRFTYIVLRVSSVGRIASCLAHSVAIAESHSVKMLSLAINIEGEDNLLWEFYA